MTPSIRSTATSLYVRTAQGLGRLLVRLRCLPASAPARERRVRHWLYSLVFPFDAVGLLGLDVPWWTYDAIDAVDSWLTNRDGATRVFEYGSGASTVWLAARADEVHSVENDPGFAALMTPHLARADNVTQHVVPAVASEAPVIGSAKAGYGGLDFADYVATIDAVGGEFELIVIDGRAREACLQAALAHLAPDGVIVFDNTRRRRYRDAIARTDLVEQRLTGLTPTLPYPDTTSLLRRRAVR